MIFRNFFLTYSAFWKKHPAFFVGLHLLLGLSIQLGDNYSFVLIALFLAFPFFFLKENRKESLLKVAMGIAILGIGFFYGNFSKIEFPSSDDEIIGSALFSPTSVKIHHSPFQKSYVYRGELLYFEGVNGETATRLPCSIYLPLSAKRPPANTHFFLEGTLIKKESRLLLFQSDKYKKWKTVENTFSWAEWRFIAKEKLHTYLAKHIKDPKALSFLFALCSGDIDERMLSFEFGKLGLQHILAISGFHFALLAAFCGFLLKKILPETPALILLLLLLTAYFFFLGSSPSVLRAWTAIFLWIIARLIHRKTSGLNALGVGLIVELLYDPSIAYHLGFQLSFLSTAAILLLLPITSSWMKYLLPQRSLKELEFFSWFDKIGYLGCSLLRASLSLNLAVHLASMPVCLFHFHKFPWLSLAYNLFFPFWAGLSLLLLLWASLLTLLVPPLGELVHSFNNKFTSLLLDITSNPPALLDFFARVSEFPLLVLLLYLVGLFYLAIGFGSAKKEEWLSL